MSDRDQRRMTDAEAVMWDIEKDPALRSSFLNVTFLDGPADIGSFRERLARAVRELPRLRQRVVPEPLHLAPPMWEDDPSFDLDYHVRHLAVAGAAGERDVLDLAALLYQDPFDRARPLWQFAVVDGLADGRGALLAKMHHTITDGVGGVRLSAQFIDLERHPAAPAAGGSDTDTADGSAAGADGADGADGDRFLDDVAGALTHSLRRRLGIGRRAATALVGAAVNPVRAIGLAGEVGAAVSSLLRQALVVERAHSELWAGRRSLGRRFEVSRIDLEQLKSVAKRLGGTVNDAYVTGVSGGIARYHRVHAVDVDELRMAMPISTRTDRSAGGNSFVPTRVLVPAGIEDPTERFREVSRRVAALKQERALSLTDTFATVLTSLPTELVVRVAQSQAATVDFAASNVRGAPFDLFIAGAHVDSNHPMGPTAGTPCNVTVLSYRGSLDVGINVDTAAVPDSDVLRDCIDESFAELLAL